MEAEALDAPLRERGRVEDPRVPLPDVLHEELPVLLGLVREHRAADRARGEAQAVSMNTAFANELIKRTEDKRSLENQALRSMQDDYNAEQQASRRSLEGALEVSARKSHLW